MAITNDKLISMYEVMLKARRVEEKLSELFKEGLLPGWVHTGHGQEAIPAGACSALKKDDFLQPTHRGAIWFVSKEGVDLKRIMAEFYCKKTGYNGGKGASFHIGDIGTGLIVMQGILGAALPVCAGMAYAFKVKKTGQIVLCAFGEGAACLGTFHETLNLASLWKLPIVFLCESNQWVELTPRRIHLSVERICDRASSYGIPGEAVDGNDIVQVYEVVDKAVKRARDGMGPSLIECFTYRMGGHYEGDPCLARPDGEVEEWKKKDPVERFEKELFKKKILNKNVVNEVEQRIKKEIDDAISFASESPFPEPEDLYEGVYAD